MRITPQEPLSQPAPATPAKFRPDIISIRDRKAIDTLINVGLLLDKKLEKEGLVVKYYDEKGEILLLKKTTSWGAIQYEVYKVASNEFATELNYDQLPKLLIITTTTDRINIEHYIPGATWENRINKLAEDKLDGKEQLPKIRKAPRPVKQKSK